MSALRESGENGHPPRPSGTGGAGFARRLGLFDAVMLVMGGIVGSGIFMNPHVVARIVDTPWLILGAWSFGGVLALAGAFIYAELAARRPAVGGQYAYIREAFHPLPAFLFGWGLFLVSTSGGLAAVAMTFSRYTISLTGTSLPEWSLAAGALAILTGVNCLGVRTGGTVQSGLMVIKIAAIVLLVVCGYLFSGTSRFDADAPTSLGSGFDLLTSFGAAMVPVMFAYGGWQTANFIAGEIKTPEKNLPRGLLFGVLGVVALYLSVNIVSIMVLGADGLALSPAPASEVMRSVLGETGAKVIACGIMVSTFGFLSQGILTAPRVYFAMAEDGLFFRNVSKLHPRTHVPVMAILLQGAAAILVTLSGTYEQILSYVVSDDFIFFGLSAACLFVFRRADGRDACAYRVPGHPFTTIAFILVCAAVVITTVYSYPVNTLIGIGILVTGIPVYYFWRGGAGGGPAGGTGKGD
ncbi:MAG TPA: amino acid permease [Bacteroidota bacterium]|nr:amino acid permease [Bacteroidota bacterium]